MADGGTCSGFGMPVSLTLTGGTQAASMLRAAMLHHQPALTLVFGSPTQGLVDLLAHLELIHPATPDSPVMGCSSAGEFDRCGYGDGQAVAVLFPRASFAAAVTVLRDVSGMPVTQWRKQMRALADSLPDGGHRNGFALLLPDGETGQEDMLIACLDATLPWLRLVGGSAGRALDGTGTALMLNGQRVQDAALLAVLETDIATQQIVCSNARPTDRRMVVTAADPATRSLIELNAETAASEYARLIGQAESDLTPTMFARHPLLLRMGDRHHVRAISGVGPDGSLTMMAATEEGMVLTLGQASGDPVSGLRAALEALPQRPALILGFDCVLRRLAVEKAGLQDALAQLYADWNVVGFNTFGEQHGGMHVNQTFVGLAFLPGRAKDDGHDDVA